MFFRAAARQRFSRSLCGSRDAVGATLHLHSVTAAMAKGKHPVPFRTRKLSSSAPMVLRGGPRGRVGRRRTSFTEGRPLTGAALGVCMRQAGGCTPAALSGRSGPAVGEDGLRTHARERGGGSWTGTGAPSVRGPGARVGA